MTDVDSQNILEQTALVIPENRQYWLVRTMGGDYYAEYFHENYVAIGYDKISLKDIHSVTQYGSDAQKKLSEKIDNRYNDSENKEKEEVNASYAAAQLLRFCTQIKVGDVVIVPGRSNEKFVAIGVVEKAVQEVNVDDKKESKCCPFKKRIKVSWINQYLRNNLNPQIQLMFNSRHIVSNVNHYAEYIDSTTGDFYTKGDVSYLVLRVKTSNAISGCDFLFVGDVYSIMDDFANENNEDIDVENINMKVCVQSPGDIILYATSPGMLVLFGLIILFLNGGGLKIKNWGVDLSSKGLIKNISEYLDRNRDRKLQKVLQKKLENLKIDNPDDFLKALKELQNPRKEY